MWAAAASSAHAQLVPRPQLLSPVSAVGSARLVRVSSAASSRTSRAATRWRRRLGAWLDVSAFAVSDRDGRFTFRSLPAGPYLVRAHLQEYLPARGRVVQVTPDAKNATTIALTRRSDAKRHTVGCWRRRSAPDEDEPAAEPAESEHGHDEVAWRLRHLKRSVLKTATAAIEQDDDDTSLFGDSLAGLGVPLVTRPASPRRCSTTCRSTVSSICSRRRRSIGRRICSR